MSVLGGISAGVNIAQGLFNMGSQAWQNHKNQENMEETWRREDSAVQRRAADLEAAGLSRTLAAGSAASSSAPIRMEAPQLKLDPLQAKQQAEMNEFQKMSMEKQLMSMDAQISRTRQQEALDKAQEDKVRQDIAWNDQFNPEKLTEKQLKNQFNNETFQNRVDTVAANKNIAELKTAVMNAEIKLKEKLGARADAQSILDGVDKAVKIAQEARLKQLTEIQKERWEREKIPGGIYETNEEMLATKLVMLQIELENIMEKEGVKGYLSDKIKQGWKWFWTGKSK